ncbi:MAG: hypothetical protein ACHQ9S_02855 [Candidatus Binatia bacterium]
MEPIMGGARRHESKNGKGLHNDNGQKEERMIGFKKAGWLLSAAAGGILLVGSAAYASPQLCEPRIELATKSYHDSVYSALTFCADSVERAKMAHSPLLLTIAAGLCEGALKNVYDVTNTKPYTTSENTIAKNRFRNGIYTLFHPVAGSPTCTAQDLVALSHQVSGGVAPYSSAPGANTESFLTDYELLTQETAAIQAGVGANTELLALVSLAVNAQDSAGGTCDLAKGKCTIGSGKSPLTTCTSNLDCYRGDFTNCGVCNLDQSPPKCAGGSQQPCATNADCTAGTKRPNLCSFNAECNFRTCNAPGSFGNLTAGSLGGGNAGIFLPGQQSLGVCQTAPTASRGYGQGAGENLGTAPGTVYVTGSDVGSLKPVSVAGTTLVCVNQLGAEGWCDCGGGGGNKNVSYCQDRLASQCQGGHCTDVCDTLTTTCTLGGGGCTSNADCVSGTACTSNADCPDKCGNNPVTGFTTNPDSDFVGTQVGPAVPSFGGGSANGDCMILETTQFKQLTIAIPSELGSDGLPCTPDDQKAPGAPVTVPLTTGSSTSTMHNAVLGTATPYGLCDGNAATECIDGNDCKGCNLTCAGGLCPDGKTACTSQFDCTLPPVCLPNSCLCTGPIGPLHCVTGAPYNCADGVHTCTASATQVIANAKCTGAPGNEPKYCNKGANKGAVCTANSGCGYAGVCNGDGGVTCKQSILASGYPLGGCANVTSECDLNGTIDIGDMTAGPVTGAKVTCADFVSGQLSGIQLVGSFPSGGGTKGTLGDTITGFTLVCGS